MRKWGVGIAVWMVLMIGLAVHLHGGSHKSATPGAGQTTTTASQDKQPAANIPPQGPAPAYVPPSAQTTESGDPNSGSAVPQASAEDQQKLSLATAGWPAVAKLPWSRGAVSVDFAGVGGGRVVLNVNYDKGTVAQAREAVDAFLLRNNDLIRNYRLRFISKAAQADQQQLGLAASLASKGYTALPYLPLKRGKTTVSFAGMEGTLPVLLAVYRGTLARAQRDATALLAELHDTPSHYALRYQKA